MAIDLRETPFNKDRTYWRGVREGRLPWPKYKKPVVTAIKLDPKQAILAVCIKYSNGGAWMLGTICAYARTGWTDHPMSYRSQGSVARRTRSTGSIRAGKLRK